MSRRAVDRGENPVAGPKSEVDATNPVYPGTASTSGDRTVVFEEKKNWFGRTKVVPKPADVGVSAPADVGTSASTSAAPAAATTLPAQ